ncbi:MAG: HNH endonuclease [Candidatus Methanomethylicaceae archaeon]
MARIVDPAIITAILYKRDRTCLYGLYVGDPCNGGLEVHHIEKRSQIGDDVPENLITLCHKHHQMAEQRLIDPDKFREILRYFGADQWQEK